jgi:hypothetical protein
MSSAAQRALKAAPVRDTSSMIEPAAPNTPASKAEAAPAAVTAVHVPAASLSNRRVLRMLTGPHSGAESELQAERLLVGNLETECDIVLDVSRPERHICLIRTSADGWTVLSIAGDLWVGEDYVEPQQTRDIASGMVITLGRVAFAVANPAEVDWAQVKPVFELVRPDPTGPMPSATLLPSRPAKMLKWHALKLAAGIGVSALILASAGAYLSNAWSIKVPSPDVAIQRLKSSQALVNGLPFAKELQVTVSPDNPNRMLIQGFLPQRAQVVELERVLSKANINVELRLAMVDDMSNDLVKRLEKLKPDQVRYVEQGRFTVNSNSELLKAHDRQARLAMQEMPLLNSLNMAVEDVQDSSGSPIVVRYERSTDRPGDLVVSDLDVIQQRQRYVIKELRGGSLPSVVLDNGMRYFEGATLPDSSILKQIGLTELVVQHGRGERVIPIPLAAQAASSALSDAAPAAEVLVEETLIEEAELPVEPAEKTPVSTKNKRK